MSSKENRPSLLMVDVEPELFLVSPNRQKTTGAELHLVTTENCSAFVNCWKDSKLFDFKSLYGVKGTLVVYSHNLRSINKAEWLQDMPWVFYLISVLHDG